MALTGNQEAHELLLIEEADAWFEYLEATRGQSAVRYLEDGALGLGPALTATAGEPHPPFQAPAGCRSRLRIH